MRVLKLALRPAQHSLSLAGRWLFLLLFCLLWQEIGFGFYCPFFRFSFCLRGQRWGEGYIKCKYVGYSPYGTSHSGTGIIQNSWEPLLYYGGGVVWLQLILYAAQPRCRNLFSEFQRTGLFIILVPKSSFKWFYGDNWRQHRFVSFYGPRYLCFWIGKRAASHLSSMLIAFLGCLKFCVLPIRRFFYPLNFSCCVIEYEGAQTIFLRGKEQPK